MMLVLAMQFSKAGWPQCPQIGLEGPSLTGQWGCGERAEPTTNVVGAPSKRNSDAPIAQVPVVPCRKDMGSGDSA
jgi:hypothetical protein